MSDFADKMSHPEYQWADDGMARARLFQHLASRGYMVKESDQEGPYRIVVNGMRLQTWRRYQKVNGQKDWWFELENEEPWRYE